MHFAIGDIHGCYATFEKLIHKIPFDQGDTIIFLGDYIDRGPDSKSVIDFINGMIDSKFLDIVLLKGNHEQIVLDIYDGNAAPNREKQWLTFGGKETLASFGVKRIKDIPAEYIEWMRNLKHYHTTENYWLAHAGFDFSMGKPFADEHQMLWIRDFVVDYNVLGENKIIHGHTPVLLQQTQLQVAKNEAVINLDTSCVYHGQKNETGYLTAMCLETQELVTVGNCEPNFSWKGR